MTPTRETKSFRKFWGEWRKHLIALVEAQGGKFLCPETVDIVFEENAMGFVARPKWPICFYNVRQKGNGSEAAKLVFFIDGLFEFVKLPDESVALASAHSNVAFFRVRAGLDGANELDLIDAYHFDHFKEDPKGSQPHPVFHAQRNIRPDTIYAKFKESLLLNRKEISIREIKQEEKNLMFGLKTFRLPTPQIDLFSLSAILVADHLVDNCGHGNANYGSFKKFLKHLSDDESTVVQLIHQQQVRAEVAERQMRLNAPPLLPTRFVWQWYSRH